jgi:DNA-directed RNA polymerase subunit RPC12/RpoP
MGAGIRLQSLSDHLIWRNHSRSRRSQLYNLTRLQPRHESPAMYMNVVCPTCGNKCRVPESALGQRVTCPSCSNAFQCGSLSPPSLVATPLAADGPGAVQAVPESRAVGTQPHPHINYRCPRCAKSLESPASSAGEKVDCPDCGQRLQIPRSVEKQVPVSHPVTAIEQTAWARLASQPVAAEQPTPAPVATAKQVAIEPVQSPGRRENCLECGKDVSDRTRIQACPDCGSLLCCAMCFREHRYHAHPSRR